MVNDFCPKCNALTNMMLTTTENKEKNDEGRLFKVITTTYNCSRCHTFVKSENKQIYLNSEEV